MLDVHKADGPLFIVASETDRVQFVHLSMFMGKRPSTISAVYFGYKVGAWEDNIPEIVHLLDPSKEPRPKSCCISGLSDASYPLAHGLGRGVFQQYPRRCRLAGCAPSTSIVSW